MRMLGLNVNPSNRRDRLDRRDTRDGPPSCPSSRSCPSCLKAPMYIKRRRDEDFADEIEAHVALETEQLIGEGMRPAEARLAARRTFGNVTAVQEWYYESHRILWLDHLRQDVRGAVRSVMRY